MYLPVLNRYNEHVAIKPRRNIVSKIAYMCHDILLFMFYISRNCLEFSLYMQSSIDPMIHLSARTPLAARCPTSDQPFYKVLNTSVNEN